LLSACALLQSCPNDSELTCGTGTRAMGDQCVPISVLGCGAGTKELNGQCIPDGNVNPTECGPGTQEIDDQCLPTTVITCGPDTENVNDECVSTVLTGGNYLQQFIELQNLEGIGSHTDEVRLRDDDILMNCSYTFNVIDVSDPRDMEILTPIGSAALRHTAVPLLPGQRVPGCKHLAWDGELVFTTHPGNIRDGASFLSGWDITETIATRSDRTHAVPTQLAVLQEAGMTYQGVAASNGNVYVARRENGLGVYRYEVPTTTTSTIPPRFVNIGSLGGFTNAWGMAARDNTVFMTDLSEAFVTVDVTDPTTPVELGRVVIGGTARFLDVDGDYAYIAAGSAGVAIIDISDLANPTVVGRATMPGTAVRLDYSEGRIFVAAWNDVRVFDVTDPTAPEYLGALRIRRPFEYDELDRESPTMRVFGVAADGQNVYVGAWENPYSYWFEPDREVPNLRLPENFTRLDFGPVAAGETKTIQLEVTNQGRAPLTLTDVSVIGEGFSVAPRQALIAAGESVMLDISFASTSTEVQTTGFLDIESDDPSFPLRRSFVVANSPGIAPGNELPNTTGLLIDGTIWNSSTDSAGSVLLLFYFATF
jgi:hypothetical protein